MRDQNGESAILKAVYHGQQDVVTALLASGVELDILSTPTHPTFTPLGLATYFGHEAVKLTPFASAIAGGKGSDRVRGRTQSRRNGSVPKAKNLATKKHIRHKQNW